MLRAHLKPLELLETPNVKPRAISSEAPKWGTFNDHPRGVPPSGGKRGARKRDDMVCSAWRHAAVHKRTGAELASRVEQKVKRAGFKWGIGTELYTAPEIKVFNDKCEIKHGRNGKPACYDKFAVTEMEVEDGQIVKLQVCNMSKKGLVVYGSSAPEANIPANDVLKVAWERVKKAVWDWCQKHECATEQEFKAKLDGIRKRPEWESQSGSLDYLNSLVREFEDG